MKQMINMLSSVRSWVTLMLTATVCKLAWTGQIEYSSLKDLYMLVLTFYFVVKHLQADSTITNGK